MEENLSNIDSSGKNHRLSTIRQLEYNEYDDNIEFNHSTHHLLKAESVGSVKDPRNDNVINNKISMNANNICLPVGNQTTLKDDRKVTRDRIKSLQPEIKVPLINVMEKIQEIREVSEDGLFILKKVDAPETFVEAIRKAINLIAEGIRINISLQESLLSIEDDSINITNILKQELTESKHNSDLAVTNKKLESDDDDLNTDFPESYQQQRCDDDKDILLNNLPKHVKNENEVVEIKLENAEPPPELHSDPEQASDTEPTTKEEIDEFDSDFDNKKKTKKRKKKDIEDEDLPKKKRNRKKGPISTCNQCGKTFKFNYLYIQHMQRHVDERPFKCDKCYRGFGTKGTLKAHVQSVHETERPYKCDLCPKGFYLKTGLESHKYIHTGERPYKCEFCGVGWTTSSNLVKHVRIHTGEKPHVCDICQKAFISSVRMTEHRRSHTGDKPYSCEVCGKSFSRNSHLKRHKLLHSTEKPFQCEICEKQFTRVDNWKAHMNTHSSVKTE